jgi:hypothetical protein
MLQSLVAAGLATVAVALLLPPAASPLPPPVARWFQWGGGAFLYFACKTTQPKFIARF